jgi:integrase/recombinase XerD
MMDPSRVRVTGPLERYAPGFLAELIAVGYKRVSAALQLQLMAHLSRWMAADELGPERLSLTEAERFLAARRAAGYMSSSAASA